MTETFPICVYPVKASDAWNGRNLPTIQDMYVAYCGGFRTAFRPTLKDAVISLIEQISNDARPADACDLVNTVQENQKDRIIQTPKEALKNSIWNVFGTKN